LTRRKPYATLRQTLPAENMMAHKQLVIGIDLGGAKVSAAFIFHTSGGIFLAAASAFVL
jgi:hypothetical protein